MSKAHSKTKDTDTNAKRPTSGRLRTPNTLSVRRVSDFSTSFTKKLKMNNSSLVKSLAAAKATIERQAEELKYQKTTYTELLMKTNAFEVRHKESTHRMNGYVVRSMTQIRDAVDTLIAMQDELRTMKADESSYRRFPSEPSQPRASGSTQTLSVGPMVQGHSIRQPHISLLRITPPLRNGGCVPAAPVPAVPASADARASPARAVTRGSVPDGESPVESIGMFYQRLRRENPMEGSSSGKRFRPFHPPPLDQPSSDDDDDDDDGFEPIDAKCNRTSYSPTNMDITLGSRRLSTIVQESSPSAVDVATNTGGDNTAAPEHRYLNVEEVSPIEHASYGFTAANAIDRSLKELRPPPWNELENAGTGAIKVAKPVINIRIVSRPELPKVAKPPADRSDLSECKVDNSKTNPSGASDSKVTESKSIGSSERKEHKAAGHPSVSSEVAVAVTKTKTKPKGSSVSSKGKATAEPIGTNELKAGHFSASTSDTSDIGDVKSTPYLLTSPIGSKEQNQAELTTKPVAKTGTKPSGSGSGELDKRKAAANLSGSRKRKAVLDGRDASAGKDARSAPNPETKRPRGVKLDPDWTPLSDPSCTKLRLKRKALIKRRVHGSDNVVRPSDVPASDRLRVLVNRLNPGDIAEALSRSSLRSPQTKVESLQEEPPDKELKKERVLRRVLPTCYKEPSLHLKLRRS